jgi:Na+/H+-dicarboxylate symporter/ABC-type amino acid transport substrate-binding protein
MSTGSVPRRDSRSFVGALIAGLSAGVATGLFFGEWTRVLQPAADGFVRLLQMAVLPYVTVSLVANIGALSLDELRSLGGRAALVLLGLWSLALGCAFLMPATFPAIDSGTFFSTTLVERPPPVNLVDLYIPANPFFALANNIVPAVVFFSIFVGTALIGVPRKQAVLDVLATGVDTLARVMRFVARLTPYGLFAIAATAAGSLRIEQASRLQLYLVVYAALALLLALWMLPGLVAALTPIPVRAVFAATRDALVMATIAGDLFIVLPLLIAACKELTARFGAEARHATTLPDVIVPMSYNFPHSGKLLSVSFVLFAGWFADTPLDVHDYPQLALTSIVTLFGSVTSAMPFLLDLFHVPLDTFQLFLATGVINSRFGTLVAAMHTIAVALLGTCAMAGLVRWRRRALVRYVAITGALIVAVIGAVRFVATELVGHDTTASDALAAMHLDERTDAVVVPAMAPGEDPPGTRLDAILTRRIVRVCYLADALPFAFLNARHELVGFDVAFMHGLAIELGARLQFVPVARDDLDDPEGMAVMLRNGQCDCGIGGIAVTTGRARAMRVSSSYMSETLAFVVRDEAAPRFESWETIRQHPSVTIAVPDVPYYVDKLRRQLPNARLQTVTSLEALFAPEGADAIALPAERGSAWTLRYPRYSVVVPGPNPIRIPLAYVTPHGEAELADLVNTWIELKRSDGTLERLYQYWILGRDPAARTPRWSIIRNVLHWTH